MLLILEIVMLLMGLLALATGKLPSALLGGSLLGGPKYKLEGPGVRLLGLILTLPIPLALVGGVLLGFLLGQEGEAYAMLLELVIVVTVGIVAIIVSRLVRKPAATAAGEEVDEAADDDLAQIEAKIAKKANGSLIYVFLGLLGPACLLLCPLASVRSNQALRLIDEYQVGEKYRSTAKGARILAAVIFVGYASLAALIIVPAVLSMR